MLAQRPLFHVRTAPTEPRVGQPLSVIVTVECLSDLNADQINLRLAATERRADQFASKLIGPKLVHFCAEQSFACNILYKGRSTFTLECELPPDAPPSFRSARTLVEWELDIHVSVDWDVDVRESVPLTVLAQLDAEPHSEPKYVAFAAKDGAPLIECALAPSTLAAGEDFELRFAVSQLGKSHVLQVDLQLVSVEDSARAEQPIVTELQHWCLHRGRIEDGATVARALRVPEDVQRSFDEASTQLAHKLVLTVLPEEGDALAREIPCRIVTRNDPPTLAREIDAIGSERLAEVWKRIALEAQRRDPQGSRVDRAAQRGNFSQRDIVASIEPRAHEALGEATAIELRYPSLGLALTLDGRTWLHRAKGEEPFDAAFLRKFRCALREPRQCREAFTPRLQRALARFDDAAMDDARLVLWCSAQSMTVSAVAQIFDALDDVIEELSRFEERVQPPARLEAIAAQQRAFAEERGARLRPGDLGVERWSVRGLVVTIEYEFDGERPAATIVRARGPAIDDAIAAQLRARYINRLALEDGAAVVSLPQARPAAEVEQTALSLVQAIVELHERERGAYR
jgi:hypothetical protein